MNYKTKRWQRKRAAILRRDKFTCQETLRYGKRVTATTVHHIYPVEFWPELAYVSWNLISLSTEQHNAMHDRDSHELTALGKQLQRRRAQEFNTWQTSRENRL